MDNFEKEKKLSNIWKKLKILSGVFASILVPVAIFIIGNSYSNAIKQREIQIIFQL